MSIKNRFQKKEKTPQPHLQVRLIREANARCRRLLENNILALEENVAEDAESNARVGLNTSEARRAAVLHGCVVDVLSGDALLDAAEDESEVRESSRAREDVAAIGVAILGARDLCVVGADDRGGEVEEAGACVGDAVNGR